MCIIDRRNSPQHKLKVRDGQQALYPPPEGAGSGSEYSLSSATSHDGVAVHRVTVALGYRANCVDIPGTPIITMLRKDQHLSPIIQYSKDLPNNQINY